MEPNTTVIKDKKIHTTTDYFLFKNIDGNRNKNLLHLNRLRKSMQSNYLFTVIIVNEKFEIIDGQHRFDIIKELKLPLNYILCKGYGLNEVHILNQNSKTWNSNDYLEGYCKLGYKDYVIYRDFKNEYGIGHNETLALLSGGSRAKLTQGFFQGEFKVKSYDYAVSTMEKILMITPYYEGVRRRAFIYAMISLFNNKNFDFHEFLKKLKLQPTALMDCTNTDNYRILIENIYNYKRREKVNLRYS
jgi:hypothetical protein